MYSCLELNIKSLLVAGLFLFSGFLYLSLLIFIHFLKICKICINSGILQGGMCVRACILPEFMIHYWRKFWEGRAISSCIVTTTWSMDLRCSFLPSRYAFIRMFIYYDYHPSMLLWELYGGLILVSISDQYFVLVFCFA